MAETFATVSAEVTALGMSRGNVDVGRLVNDAYAWLVKKYLWPFRETTASGAAPLTIADLGSIASVTDTANGNKKLNYRDRRTLVECVGDLTTAGSPSWFYVEGGTVVKTYPAGGTLSVRYWKNAAVLTGTNPLIVPDQWVQLVIDRAHYRGLLRIGDWAGAASLKSEIKDALDDMVVDLLATQASDPDQVVVYDAGWA